MKDAEIIKALSFCSSEHLGCEDGCPYIPRNIDDKFCGDAIRKDALDLINRQNEEIDILIRKNETLKDEVSELQLKNASCNAEIERLKDIAKGALNESINICDFILDAKAEAIKEFVDRLKEEFRNRFFTDTDLDNLVKEMVGDVE